MFNGSKPHAHGADAHGNVHTESAGPALDLILELNGEWHGKQEAGGEADQFGRQHALSSRPACAYRRKVVGICVHRLADCR